MRGPTSVVTISLRSSRRKTIQSSKPAKEQRSKLTDVRLLDSPLIVHSGGPIVLACQGIIRVLQPALIAK